MRVPELLEPLRELRALRLDPGEPLLLLLALALEAFGLRLDILELLQPRGELHALGLDLCKTVPLLVALAPNTLELDLLLLDLPLRPAARLPRRLGPLPLSVRRDAELLRAPLVLLGGLACGLNGPAVRALELRHLSGCRGGDTLGGVDALFAPGRELVELALEGRSGRLGLLAAGVGRGNGLACGLDLASRLLAELTGALGGRLQGIALGCEPHELGRQLLGPRPLGVALLVGGREMGLEGLDPAAEILLGCESLVPRLIALALRCGGEPRQMLALAPQRLGLVAKG